jgi:hypothetical protein
VNLRNARAQEPIWDPQDFIGILSDWLDTNQAIVDGIRCLVDLDGEGEPAIQAILAMPSVRKIRYGWQLWDALVEGTGEDPDALLLEHLAYDRVDEARSALLGVPDRHRRHLWLVAD